jgi:hypothetical protein
MDEPGSRNRVHTSSSGASDQKKHLNPAASLPHLLTNCQRLQSTNQF